MAGIGAQAGQRRAILSKLILLDLMKTRDERFAVNGITTSRHRPRSKSEPPIFMARKLLEPGRLVRECAHGRRQQS
jgi:hypothetical protein